MTRFKVSELSGYNLDRAVAMVGAIPEEFREDFHPSKDEHQATEMLDLDDMQFRKFSFHPAPELWVAYKGGIEWLSHGAFRCHGPSGIGPTKMVAALRCFLAAETKDLFIELEEETSNTEKQRSHP
jgi:hypothetical protein